MKYVADWEVIEENIDPKEFEGDADFNTLKCSICGFMTGIRVNLEIHKRVHSGNRPFKCKMCDQASAKKSDIALHIKRHHGLSVVSKKSRSSKTNAEVLREFKSKNGLTKFEYSVGVGGRCNNNKVGLNKHYGKRKQSGHASYGISSVESNKENASDTTKTSQDQLPEIASQKTSQSDTVKEPISEIHVCALCHCSFNSLQAFKSHEKTRGHQLVTWLTAKVLKRIKQYAREEKGLIITYTGIDLDAPKPNPIGYGRCKNLTQEDIEGPDVELIEYSDIDVELDKIMQKTKASSDDPEMDTTTDSDSGYSQQDPTSVPSCSSQSLFDTSSQEFLRDYHQRAMNHLIDTDQSVDSHTPPLTNSSNSRETTIFSPGMAEAVKVMMEL